MSGRPVAESRFAALGPWAARLVLAICAALILAPLAAPATPPSPAHRPGVFDDLSLYRTIAERVAAGESYYAAAADEHRRNGYPTAPPQVFRPPTLAWLSAALRTPEAARVALYALLALAVVAVRRALDAAPLSPAAKFAATLLAGCGLLQYALSAAADFHEMWAALLILISMSLRRPDRWGLAVAAGLAACLFREIALPYLAVMAAVAVIERRRGEALAWAGAAAAFLGLYAGHLAMAATQTRAGDSVSPGWLGFGGWPFVIAMAKRNVILSRAPDVIAAATVCLSLVGLFGAPHPWTLRIGAVLAAFGLAFSVVGRPDNDYWGLLFTPLLPLGLIFAPAQTAVLWRRAMGRSGGGATGVEAPQQDP